MTLALEAANRALFLSMNAPAGLTGPWLAAAKLASSQCIIVLAVLLALMWARGDRGQRAGLLTLSCAAAWALLLNYVIGAVWPHPRPFMVPIGHTFLEHAAENSFPSDHATLMWTFALGLWWVRSLRGLFRWALALAALTSWARVFLGVHFPFDILGSIAVALFALVSIGPARSWIDVHLAPRVERLHGATLGRALR